MVELCVEGRPLSIEVDTGVVVTLVSEATYKKHFDGKPLLELSVRLKTYTEESSGAGRGHMSYGTQQGTCSEGLRY